VKGRESQGLFELSVTQGNSGSGVELSGLIQFKPRDLGVNCFSRKLLFKSVFKLNRDFKIHNFCLVHPNLVKPILSDPK
jgi:hypothetical protein